VFKSTIVVSICVVISLLSLVAAAQQVDPTKPFGSSGYTDAKSKKIDKLILQSIVKQSSEKNAIISGKLLKVGDKIGKYKLKRIKTNSVILMSADNKIELSLFSDVVAK